MFLSFKNIKAQPYEPLIADSVNEWCVEYNYGFFTSRKKYRTTTDTIINGKLYRTIVRMTSDSTSCTEGYIREDIQSKKVFYIDNFDIGFNCSSSLDTSERLLYDFSKGIGDTIFIDNINDSTKAIQELYIDTIFFHQNLKTFKLKFEHSISGNFENVYWKEGVGSELGIESNINFKMPYETVSQSLNCAIKDNVELSICAGSCESYVFIKDVADNILEIYPNPTSNILYFKSDKQIEMIELFDLRGKSILSTNSKRIQTSSLPEGVYLYLIRLSDGEVISGKFIKESTF